MYRDERLDEWGKITPAPTPMECTRWEAMALEERHVEQAGQ